MPLIILAVMCSVFDALHSRTGINWLCYKMFVVYLRQWQISFLISSATFERLIIESGVSQEKDSWNGSEIKYFSSWCVAWTQYFDNLVGRIHSNHNDLFVCLKFGWAVIERFWNTQTKFGLWWDCRKQSNVYHWWQEWMCFPWGLEGWINPKQRPTSHCSIDFQAGKANASFMFGRLAIGVCIWERAPVFSV